MAKAIREKDDYTRKWIIENSVDILKNYDDGVLTIRGLHYQLVSIGMTNDIQHYKRVVAAMEVARWDGVISFSAFSDRDREMIGNTPYEVTDLDSKVTEAKRQVRAWMESYSKNKWENQPFYPEVLIEKKALEGVFDRPCARHDVNLGACKGYPSLTFLHDMYHRFADAEQAGKMPIIIYFGDYDPSGDDIPRSLIENLKRFGVRVELRRIALNHEQVLQWKLPPAPAKVTDSRTANWDGLGQVELDAVKPERLIRLLDDAISDIFDTTLYDELNDQEDIEREDFQKQLRDFVANI